MSTDKLHERIYARYGLPRWQATASSRAATWAAGSSASAARSRAAWNCQVSHSTRSAWMRAGVPVHTPAAASGGPTPAFGPLGRQPAPKPHEPDLQRGEQRQGEDDRAGGGEATETR